MPLPRPPSADPLVALADQCVQCGLCLNACPTYRQGRIEAESPRGRIALARGWALHALEPTATGEAHLDACLACRSCEAVCPAGVRYGELLLEARRRQRGRRRVALKQRVVEALATRPWALRMVLAAYRGVQPWLPAQLRPLPRPPEHPRGAADTRVDAEQPGVAVFVGCVADVYEAPARAALARLLAAVGVEMRVPAGQACCGALHAHAGDAATAAALAARNADAFAGAATVLTLATGCHEAIAAAVRAPAIDALDYLAARVDRLQFVPYAERVALHVPCTQRNVVRSAPALCRLLAAVPGLDLVELDAGDGCCGAAGATMLVDPGRAASFRAPLLDQLDACGAALLLSANIGCRLHLQNGTQVPVRHPVEFLAAQLAWTPAQ